MIHFGIIIKIFLKILLSNKNFKILRDEEKIILL